MVAVSIPEGVIETFHSLNPSSRTMALVLLKEMSTMDISWGVNAAGA
jgi:hypothetical protein